jgi:hypothetical protein
MRILVWYALAITIFRIGLSIASEDKPKWRMFGVLEDVPILVFILKYLFG